MIRRFVFCKCNGISIAKVYMTYSCSFNVFSLFSCVIWYKGLQYYVQGSRVVELKYKYATLCWEKFTLRLLQKWLRHILFNSIVHTNKIAWNLYQPILYQINGNYQFWKNKILCPDLRKLMIKNHVQYWPVVCTYVWNRKWRLNSLCKKSSNSVWHNT